MKKFMFLFYGYENPTPETQQTWMSWFESIGDKVVDGGNPFSAAREVTTNGTNELSFTDAEAATGYTIINAESLEEAEAIAKTCPMIHSVQVLEAASM